MPPWSSRPQLTKSFWDDDDDDDDEDDDDYDDDDHDLLLFTIINAGADDKSAVGDCWWS